MWYRLLLRGIRHPTPQKLPEAEEVSVIAFWYSTSCPKSSFCTVFAGGTSISKQYVLALLSEFRLEVPPLAKPGYQDMDMKAAVLVAVAVVIVVLTV